jgi:alkylated DNA nucleotide flippase Atl1
LIDVTDGGAAAGALGNAGAVGPRGGWERRAAEILDRVRAVPEGYVRTYGDVSPGAPRVAGAVLSESDDSGVPWHRIVRADGSLAKGRRQRRLLMAEGVPFRGERVDMRVARVPW